MRIATKGQVTIPQGIREEFGLWPHTEVTFVAEGNSVYLRNVADGESRGSRLVRQLSGAGRIGMTTDEILALTRDRQQ